MHPDMIVILAAVYFWSAATIATRCCKYGSDARRLAAVRRRRYSKQSCTSPRGRSAGVRTSLLVRSRGCLAAAKHGLSGRKGPHGMDGAGVEAAVVHQLAAVQVGHANAAVLGGREQADALDWQNLRTKRSKFTTGATLATQQKPLARMSLRRANK